MRLRPWQTKDVQHAFELGHHFQRHIRQVHKESPFQCQAAGCDRRGAKGYFTKKGLEKHQLAEHTDLANKLKKSGKQWIDELPPYFEHMVPRVYNMELRDWETCP
jgi:hypothetical protein